MTVPKIILIWLIVTKKWCAHQCRLFRPLFALSTFFGPKTQNFWKKKKKTHAYILILHLHPKNHNHLMYSSLKMMPTALKAILGQFLPFLLHFWPKINIFEKWKNASNVQKILKITNILKITIIWHVVPQIECGQAFCQFWTIFISLPHFWPKKSNFLKNEKKNNQTNKTKKTPATDTVDSLYLDYSLSRTFLHFEQKARSLGHLCAL